MPTGLKAINLTKLLTYIEKIGYGMEVVVEKVHSSAARNVPRPFVSLKIFPLQRKAYSPPIMQDFIAEGLAQVRQVQQQVESDNTISKYASNMR